MPQRSELELEYPDAEVQTSKEKAKILPCTHCQVPLVVGQFYAAANAKCAGCKGITAPGMGGVVIPGKTDPASAKDLEDCLINPTFGILDCPVDVEHGPMELKHVSHNPKYGPSKRVGGKAGQYRNSMGETTMLQCNQCKCTVSFSTTAQNVFRRRNEISPHKHVNGWGGSTGIGTRETKGRAVV